MPRQQNWPQHFLGHEQVTNVGSAELSADGAFALGVDWTRIGPVFQVFELEQTFAGECGCISTVASGHDAVKQVDSPQNPLQQVNRSTDAH